MPDQMPQEHPNPVQAPDIQPPIQTLVAAFDAARGWQDVEPTHIVLHLVEELGEVARELLIGAGYKTPASDAPDNAMAGELADLAMLLYKLATRLDIDLDGAVRAKLVGLEQRFPVADGPAAMARYQAQNQAARPG
jgi:NTP pyrophosphatase (non-canonical NTP hydrolase)